MRFYVACLASYNSGRLHGAWVEASSDVEEMQGEIAAMLRKSPEPNVMVECPDCDGAGRPYGFNTNSDKESTCDACKGAGRVPSAEEYAIHDYDDMPSNLGEYPSLAEIAAYVEFVEACEEHHGNGTDLAKAMLENWHSVADAKDALDNFLGVYDSFKDYSDEAADEKIANHSHGKDIPEILTRYFDYDAWERDLSLESTSLDLSDGMVAVFHQ